MMKAAIVGIAGPTLGAEEAALLRATRPAGVILFRRNIADPAQLRVLIAQLRAVLPRDAVLMVDQEGGRVARLRPPHWPAHPSAAAIGAVFQRNPAAGLRAAFLSGALVGLTCADAGFGVACAPVLDLGLPGASDVIGDRAFGPDPADIARLARSFAAGLLAAGIQPVGKHAPGHGRAQADSHIALPVVEANDLAADLVPFAGNADLGWMMTAHILYPALDREHPATLSRRIIEGQIRGRAGFRGVLVSDDLAMNALTGPQAARAIAALAAGCDIALYCPGDAEGTEAVLDAVPVLTPEGAARLAAAAAQARRRRQNLHAPTLAAERDALLA
jgi:beta-N-acetylhexosaminidase